MSKTLKRPAYTLHKPSGQGRVRLDGKDHYLGEFNSPESLAEYNDLIREWLTKRSVDEFSLTVDVLCLKYTEYADRYYIKNGEPTSEPHNIRLALRYLIDLKGPTLARSFGPKSLKEVRATMIKAGCVRTSINRMVGRIKRAFRWAVQEELLAAEVITALDAIDGLRAERSDAIESAPVMPVDQVLVEAVRPYVTRQIWGMIQVQLLTAGRPGEIRMMRTCDLMMTGDVWEYRPNSHKGQHHGRERILFLNKSAQAVVREFLKPEQPTAYLFSPADAKAESCARRKAERKTPMTPSQRARKPMTNPSKKPGEVYTDKAYGHAIAVACRKADIDPWHPHQLRHTAATAIRRTHGLEGAQVVLGHSNASVTQIYAERDQSKAREIMREMQ